jgi:hypothetical protein
VFVVVFEVEWADFFGGLFEVAEFDERIAGLPPEQDHAPRAGGDPG